MPKWSSKKLQKKKKRPATEVAGPFSPCLSQLLNAEKAHNAEGLLHEATSGCIRVELVEARCTRHRTNETNRRGNDLLRNRRTRELVEFEVHNIVTGESVVELGNNHEVALRPSVGDVLADGDAVLVDLVEVLVASEGDAEFEGMLGRNEVTGTLLLEFGDGRVEVADDLVEVLLRPLRVSILVLGNSDVRREVGVVEDTEGLVITEVVAEEGNRIRIELEGEAESRAVGLVSGRLLADGRKTSLFESTREDTLSEADDGAVFLVEVVP